MCINDTFAGYSPWKFPPEMVSPLSANTIYSLFIKVKELPVLEAKLKKKVHSADHYDMEIRIY